MNETPEVNDAMVTDALGTSQDIPIRGTVQTILTNPDAAVRKQTLEDFIAAQEPIEIRVLSLLAAQTTDVDIRDCCLSRIVERGRQADARRLWGWWREDYMDADERARAAEAIAKLL